MSLSEKILCLKHDCQDVLIFCKKCPAFCPICKRSIDNAEPFEVPNPSTRAKDSPFSVVLRPSVGDFLDNYNVNDDLHIGLTNSSGKVVEFDRNGLMRNSCQAKWNKCLAINFIPDSWKDFWEEVLNGIRIEKNYNEIDYNCFDFVFEFLEKLNYPDARYADKNEMCKMLILPQVQKMIKYAYVYRQLRNQDIYIKD